MTCLRLAVAMVIFLSSGLVNAADPELEHSAAAPSLSNPRDTDLRALLAEVGTRTRKHFVVDPRVPQTVSIEGLDHQSVTYPELLSILHVYGIAIVAGDGIMEVIPDMDVRQTSLPLAAPDNIKALDDEMITSTILVKNISAAQLVPILRPMIPQYGHLAAFPDRNALIIVDRAANVRRLVEIIRTLESLPKAVDMQASKNAEKP